MTDYQPAVAAVNADQPAREHAAAAEIIGLLTERGQHIAVAESLTGGLLAAALTGIPGASAAFRGAVVAYATELKATILGVPAGLLERHGAVHPDVAAEMAMGVRRRLGASVGAATTGVAGPDPADGQPVGTVYIAVSTGPVTAGPVTAGPVTAGPVTAGPVAAGPVNARPVAAGPVAAAGSGGDEPEFVTGTAARPGITVRSLALRGSRDEIRQETVAQCLRLLATALREESA